MGVWSNWNAETHIERSVKNDDVIKKYALTVMAACLMFLNASLAAAENVEDDYDVTEILDIPVTKLVNCVNYYSGDWDHTVYYQNFEKDYTCHV